MAFSRFFRIALLIGWAMNSLAQERPPVSDDMKMVDPKLVDYWSKSTCYIRGDGSEPNIKEQCKKACFPNPDPNTMSASTCWLNGSQWLDGSSGKPLEDQHKNIPPLSIKGGYCSCNDPIILFAGDFFNQAVTEMGKILEKVICPALQALDIVVEFGSLAIPPPGKAIQGGMIAAIKTAKAYKYAYEAQDAAQEWANMIFGGFSLSEKAGCGIPPFSISKLVAKFLDIANVPDTTIPGGVDYRALPCPKNGCRGTRYGEKPDDKKHESRPPPKSTLELARSTVAPARSTAPPAASTAALFKSTVGTSRPSHIPNQSSKVPIHSSAAHTTSPTVFTTLSTSTSVRTSSVVTLDCKRVGEGLENEQTDEQAEKRDLSYGIHARRIVKRQPKSGMACFGKTGALQMRSFDFPRSGLLLNANVYGWTIPHSCSDYGWAKPQLHKDLKEKNKGNLALDTEHILEWSVITNFFTTMDDKFPQDHFVHPDPLKMDEKSNDKTQRKKVNFCTYWAESWDFKGQQKIDDPAPETGLTSDIKQRKPLEWIAANYPYREKGAKEEAFIDELVVLQRLINNPAKNNMFAPEDTQIWDRQDTEQLIKGRAYKTKKGIKKGDYSPDHALEAIQRIRSVVGVFHYMQEDKIKEIFVKEKSRIGVVIDGIDKNLYKNPREITRGDARTYDPWKAQNLGKEWNDYMDSTFKTAKDKGIAFMAQSLKSLNDEYTSKEAKAKAKRYEQDLKKDKEKENSKEKDKDRMSNAERNEKSGFVKLCEELPDIIKKLEADWDGVKDWKRPW